MGMDMYVNVSLLNSIRMSNLMLFITLELVDFFVAVARDSKSSTPSLPRLPDPKKPGSPPPQTNGVSRTRPGSGYRRPPPQQSDKTMKKVRARSLYKRVLLTLAADAGCL